jgi:hypothetical protein
MAEVTLTPLRCIKCHTNVLIEPDEVVCVCAECKQGMWLDDANGLKPLTLHYQAGVEGKGHPYWVAQGRVAVNRDTFGWGDKDNEAAQFWSVPRTFFVPAFRCTLDALVAAGIQFVQNPPKLVDGPPVKFAPVILALHDVRDVADLIIVGLEAGRSDKLKTINFKLELSTPELWILPSK